MKRSLRVLLAGGLVAAGLTIPVTPANALCAGFWTGTEEHLGVWECDSCPRPPIYGPLDGELRVVVCFAGG